MIVGLVRSRPTAEPAWFSALHLQSVGAMASRAVHLGFGGSASSYWDGGLSVVAEHRPGDGANDAGAIADAYRRLGPRCVRGRHGRFRFLVHDVASSQLFAANSTAPPWPLAYWSDSHTTVVASRILPMLRCPDVPRSLDESYLVHLVTGLSAMGDGSTAIRGIRRLCPGEVLVVDADGVRISLADRLTPHDVGGDGGQFGHVFVEALGRAVCRLARPGASVLSLSGGLDSAALAGAGLRHVKDLAALSFVAPALDGAAEIDSIAAMERAWPSLHVTRIDASETGELPDLGPDLRDDPLLTPMALLSARMLLWSRARDAGLRTVIEGEGGDELFAMLPTPLDALRRGKALEVARHVLGTPGRRTLVEHGIWLPLLPAAIRRAWLWRRQPFEAHLPAFATWKASEDPIVRQATEEYLASLVHRPFAARLNQWLSAPTVIGAALSRRHVAAGLGLELEWPMLERSVLELVLGLHAAGAIRGGPDKPFLQAALAGVVPDAVRLQPKNIGLYEAFIPRVLTSPRAREALRDQRVRARLADRVRFGRIEAMLDGLAIGRSLGATALWHLECVVGFADWYARASREYGVD